MDVDAVAEVGVGAGGAFDDADGAGLELEHSSRRVLDLETFVSERSAARDDRLDVAHAVQEAIADVEALVDPRGAVVANHVAKDGAITVPTDDTVFAPGDRVVVFTQRDQQGAVERLFKRPLLGGGG